MTNSVWIISEDEDLESHQKIMGVYTSNENAELVKAYMKSKGSYPEITEWEIDSLVAEISQGYKVFEIHMLENGDITKSEEHKYFYNSHSVFSMWRRTGGYPGAVDCLTAHVWARNEQHAVEIVNEKRAQMIASGEWAG